MIGVAPSHEIPGNHFMAATVAGVLPFRRTSRLAPYLLGGASISASRYLSPALGAVGGAGVRLGSGTFRPYVEGRFQSRTGFAGMLGLRF